MWNFIRLSFWMRSVCQRICSHAVLQWDALSVGVRMWKNSATMAVSCVPSRPMSGRLFKPAETIDDDGRSFLQEDKFTSDFEIKPIGFFQFSQVVDFDHQIERANIGLKGDAFLGSTG